MSTSAEAGWFTPALLMLPLQALAAGAAVRAYSGRVGPNIHRLAAPGNVLDSIGPFALVLPMICAAWRIGWNAGEGGWITLGAPVVIAMLALGIAMYVPMAGASVGGGDTLRPGALAAIAFSAAGALLLVLGAAHDLSVWSGQCAFAIGAVALWMNTPEARSSPIADADAQAASGMTIVGLAAITHAAAIALVPDSYRAVSAAMAIAAACMMLAVTARFAGSDATIRLGCWAAVYGVLLGLGSMSLRHLVPQALAMLRGSRDAPPLNIAYGFGAFALESMILLLLGAAAIMHDRITPVAMRRALGLGVVILAAVLAAWRLART